MSKVVGFSFFIIATIFLSGCATMDALQLVYGNQYASHTWLDDSKETELKLEYLNEHTIVVASVNGVDDLRMVLDTGAAATVLFETEKTRPFINTLNSKFTTGGIGSGNSTDVYFMHDTLLRLGSLEISGLTTLFIKAEDNPMFTTPDMAYIDGVIGYDLFSRFTTDINYSQQVVNIAEQFPTPTKNYEPIPLKINNNVPYIGLLVSDSDQTTQVTAMLDTGGIGPLLLAAGDDIPQGDVLYQSKASGLGGVAEVTANRLQKISVGNHEILQPIVAISKDESNHNIAGTGITNRFNLLIDYRSEQIYLSPNERFSKPDVPDIFGARLFPHKRGASIVSVRADSPVIALGLDVDDVILSVDGSNIHYGNFDYHNEKLRSFTALNEICFLRDSVEQCREVRQ